MSALASLLDIEIPIIQAPTGSVAGPELAAAVSLAGALGSLGLTWTDKEAAVSHVARVRELARKPFMVNYALAFDPASLAMVLDAGAPIIAFSWGLPEREMARCRAAGARVGIQVSTGEGARLALDLGPDFLICQGVEAGGHVQASLPLKRALEQVLAVAGDTPVAAAGGIADEQGIAEALRSGAAGVVMGTRFVATRESRAHALYKRRLTEAATGDTVLTVCFDGGWRHAPHRVLRNETLERWEAAGCPPPGRRPGEGDVVAATAKGLPIARYEDTSPRDGMTGSVAEMALYAGAGVGAVRDVPSAGALVQSLWRAARSLLPDAHIPRSGRKR